MAESVEWRRLTSLGYGSIPILDFLIVSLRHDQNVHHSFNQSFKSIYSISIRNHLINSNFFPLLLQYLFIYSIDIYYKTLTKVR